MKLPSVILTLLLALSCGNLFAQQKSKIDWEAEYKQLLESDPGVVEKIESGQATKEDVIRWLQETRAEKSKPSGQPSDLGAFQQKLRQLVASGKLSREDAAKLAETMGLKEQAGKTAKGEQSVDWNAEYEKLLANPTARRWIDKKGATKEEVIEFLKQQAASKSGKGKSKSRMKLKPGSRKGSFNFYALVIGSLKSKDLELGELEIDVDYVIHGKPEINAELIGKRVKLVGVSGRYLDALLQIKRGETIKVRTGDYNPETNVLGFGYKFHVLERTAPFQPGDFGVPPAEFRGFSGELTGKIVEAAGYEVLLEVQESVPSARNRAKDAAGIVGKRVRIAGFYNEHADAYADLRQGDRIRVSVVHRNTESDAIDVTDKLETVK